MAAGIGGRTIAEAKATLSYEEVVTWSQYRQKFGTLHVGMRLEMGFAQVLAAMHSAMGAKADPQDFMPHADKPEHQPLTPEHVMAQLMNVKPREK